MRIAVQTDDQRFYPYGELDTPFDADTFKEMPVRLLAGWLAAPAFLALGATHPSSLPIPPHLTPHPFTHPPHAQVTDISSSIDIETIVSSSGFSGAVSEAIVNEVGEDIDDTINTAIDTKLTAFAGSDALSGAIAGAFDTDAVQSSLAATVDKHLTRKRALWKGMSELD